MKKRFLIPALLLAVDVFADVPVAHAQFGCFEALPQCKEMMERRRRSEEHSRQMRERIEANEGRMKEGIRQLREHERKYGPLVDENGERLLRPETLPERPGEIRDTFRPPAARPAAPVDVSRGRPGYNSDEDEGPGDEADNRRIEKKVTLPAEGMARYTRSDDGRSFTLAPVNKDKRVYTFRDGRKAGLMSETQMMGFQERIPGSTRNGAGIASFWTLNNTIRDDDNGLVRYHFIDHCCGSGRYVGVVCLAYDDQKGVKTPLWEVCGPVDEDRARRKPTPY